MNAEAFIIYLFKCPCRYADQRSAPCISGNYIITLRFYDIMNAEAFIIYLLKYPCRYADQRSASCISDDYIIISLSEW